MPDYLFHQYANFTLQALLGIGNVFCLLVDGGITKIKDDSRINNSMEYTYLNLHNKIETYGKTITRL